jgi:hypothetical protein
MAVAQSANGVMDQAAHRAMGLWKLDQMFQLKVLAPHSAPHLQTPSRLLAAFRLSFAVHLYVPCCSAFGG